MISGVAIVLLLVLLDRRGVASAAWRNATGSRADRSPREPPTPPPALRRALVAGALIALPAAFLFSIRAGVVIGPLIALLLWRGAGARTLALAAGALIGVVTPALQLLLLPDDLGGFNSEYPLDLIAVHWVAVGAWVALAFALWRSPQYGQSSSGDRARAPGAAGV